MSSRIVEVEYYDGIDSVSSKLRDTALQAYINLRGTFIGISRFSIGEVLNLLSSIFRDESRCYFHRISLRRNGEWDEAIIIVCGRTVVASYGFVENVEVLGRKLLEVLSSYIGENKYTHGIVETVEVPARLVEEKLGVSVEPLLAKGRPSPRVETVEEMPSLKAEEKPAEVERVIEEASRPEEPITIPIEVSVSKTETMPSREVAREELEEAIELERPAPREAAPRKPLILEEVIQLDKPILEFSDRIADVASRELVGFSSVVISGDQDRLEVEVTITKLGIGKRREKMVRVAEELASVLSNILIKSKAPQRELSVVVRHGLTAVKIFKSIE